MLCCTPLRNDVNELFAEGTLSESRYRERFARFESCDTSLENKSGRGRPMNVEDKAPWQPKLMYTRQRSRPSSTKSGFLDWGLLSSELGGAVAVLPSSVSLAPAVEGKDPGNPPGKPPTPHGNELLNTSIILASLGFDLYFSILAGFLRISCRAAITSGSLILDNRSIKFAPAEKPPGMLTTQRRSIASKVFEFVF
uniref:Uncharacterized protein n=1 Tax=Glossina pallidipes TaxID=7398 RepID=A0A1B0A3D1_GLOPL